MSPHLDPSLYLFARVPTYPDLPDAQFSISLLDVDLLYSCTLLLGMYAIRIVFISCTFASVAYIQTLLTLFYSSSGLGAYNCVV